jgi:hypothetical protein
MVTKERGGSYSSLGSTLRHGPRILTNSATESKIVQEKPCPFPQVVSYIEAAWAFIKWASDDSVKPATADRDDMPQLLRGRGRANR